jgi:hypothetical protein
VRTGSAHSFHIALHRRHGKLVRLGPNNVSCSSATAIPVIYSTTKRLEKSNFYPVMGSLVKGKLAPSLFNSMNEADHEAIRRPVAQLYSLTNLKRFEPHVERIESLFMKKLDKLCDGKTIFDLRSWMHYFAVDVVGEIVFSKNYGFLNEERDIGGMLNMVRKRFWYVAVVSPHVFGGFF